MPKSDRAGHLFFYFCFPSSSSAFTAVTTSRSQKPLPAALPVVQDSSFFNMHFTHSSASNTHVPYRNERVFTEGAIMRTYRNMHTDKTRQSSSSIENFSTVSCSTHPLFELNYPSIIFPLSTSLLHLYSPTWPGLQRGRNRSAARNSLPSGSHSRRRLAMSFW